jgi:hypothetical protein
MTIDLLVYSERILPDRVHCSDESYKKLVPAGTKIDEAQLGEFYKVAEFCKDDYRADIPAVTR